MFADSFSPNWFRMITKIADQEMVENIAEDWVRSDTWRNGNPAFVSLIGTYWAELNIIMRLYQDSSGDTLASTFFFGGKNRNGERACIDHRSIVLYAGYVRWAKEATQGE
jgi:hypothetical protein